MKMAIGGCAELLGLVTFPVEIFIGMRYILGVEMLETIPIFKTTGYTGQILRRKQ